MNTMKTLRILAVCLLALALPLQGFATVSQSLCHSNLGHPSTPHEAAHLAHLDGHTAHEHSAHHPAAAMHNDHVTHAHAHTQADSEHKTHQCSHCAQCSAAGAMAFSEPPQFAWSAPPVVWVEVAPAFSTNASPQGLERPPRPSLS